MRSRVVSPRLRRSCMDTPANVLYGQVDWNYIKFTGGGRTAGLRRGIRWLAFAAALLAIASALAPGARAQQSANVDILFDLGDGSFTWSHVTIPDRLAVNASWNATLEGANAHGLIVSYSWSATYRIAVHDIGDRRGPSGFPGLFVWNRTARAWEFSTVGISWLVLSDGDAIAWGNAAFDSVTFAARTPVPTPLLPYPALGFRGDGIGADSPALQAGGTGTSGSGAPNGATVLWDGTRHMREIVSTPAFAFGSLYVETSRGLFALDAGTGGVQWQNPIVKGFSSPAVFDGSVIVGASNGRVYRLSASNGTEVWNTTLIAQPKFSGITSSPRVAFDWVYVGTFNESGGPGEVVSLWVSNGTIAWRHPTGSVHFSSPAVLRGIVYVGVMGDYNTTTNVTFDPPYGVTAVNRTNGGILWTYVPNGPVQSSITYADGKVFFSTNTDHGRVYALNASFGRLVWSYEPTPAEYILGSPAVSEGAVYAPSDNGHVYAFRDRGAPLATLGPASGPPKVRPGDNVSVGFIVRANLGTISNAVLNVTLPPGLHATLAEPAATRIVGQTVQWEIGTLTFPNQSVFIVHFLAPLVSGDTDFVLNARLTYADNDGTSYPALTATSSVRISGAGESYSGWAAASIVIAATVMIALFIILRRRRRRVPPP